jgi:arginyl-tRNA synthetase
MNEIKKWLEKVLKEKYGIEERVELEPTPSLKLGDFGTSICFRIAKQLGKSPQEIAEELKREIEEKRIKGVKNVSVANGYLNFFLDRNFFAKILFQKVGKKEFEGFDFGKGVKIIIEHTQINPNKAAHIGHLRNACLGDSLARLLRYCGYSVEIENYINDMGDQVALVLIGLMGIKEIEKKVKDKEFLKKLKEKIEGICKQQKLDHYCWEIYSQVYKSYEEENILKAVKQILMEMENPLSELHKFAKWFAERIVECHLQTMREIDITYDLLPRESDILALNFWQEVFEKLKQSENFVFEEKGENAGCWVVKLSKHPAFKGMKNPDKVIVKSDGTLTYTGKDIAYHFWKFGLIDKDFLYRRFSEEFAQTWITESDKKFAGACEKKFGNADKIINVIDIRQKYPQDVVKYSLEVLGYKKQADNYLHYAYEIVALSRKALKEISTLDKRYVHMSGRKGIGIKADDLIKALRSKICKEIEKRHEELSEEERSEIARKLVISALRYYMVKQNVNRLLVFDFDEALSLEGSSGIYLQYALVRAKSILKKVENAKEWQGEIDDNEWNLLLELLKYEDIVWRAEKTLDLTILTDYANELAKKFTEFYHSCQVIGSEKEALRVNIVKAFEYIFSKLLWVLGVPEVEKM